MTERILIVMPTRGRPWSALEAIASVKRTANHPDDVLIVVCEDADDPTAFRLSHDYGIDTIVAPRKRFIAWMNYAVDLYQMDQFSHVAWLGDDVRYRTPGWDDVVRSHKELVVYGRDGYQDRSLPTHPFIRTEIPQALGYLMPTELIHGCADVFIHALAVELESLAYDPQMETEHLHPDATKGVFDQTYSDALEVWPADRQTMEVIRPRIPELAAKVKNFMIAPAART